MAGDLHWSDVSLLLPCDGADASTSFPDSSTNSVTVTASGNAQIDTAQSKFGGASGLFAADGSAISFPGLFDPGADDWTVEFWFRSAGTPQTSGRLFQTKNGDFFCAISLLQESSTSIRLYADSDGATSWQYTSAAATITINTWHHIAIVREGTALRLYVDGTQSASTTIGDLADNSADTWVIGGQSTGPARSVNGHIDDVRITYGVARYSAAFTAPAAAFPDFELHNVRASIPSPIGAPSVTLNALVPVDARVSIPSPLGAPSTVLQLTYSALILMPSPLGAPASYVLNDFTGLITDPSARYVLRITGDPVIEIPISSWQATMQTGRQSFLQAIIPSAQDYVTDITARQGVSQMVVYRQTTIGGSTLEAEIARTPLSTVLLNQGSRRYTLTVQGYAPAFADAVPSKTVQLAGVRQVSQTIGGAAMRVRADIDWLLRPGQTVQFESDTFTAAYINYFVPSIGDAYMDVGTRG